jgi:hypothetical protein
LFDWGVVRAGVAVGAAILGTAACVIAEPCGLAEIAVVGGLAVGEGTAIVLVGWSAAVGPAILGGAVGGIAACKMQNAASGSDCPPANSVDSTHLSPTASRQLGGLAGRADETVADVIKSRGGGASQVNQLETGYGQMKLGDVAQRAADGDPQAVKALKMVKQAGTQGKGGK